MINNKRVLAIIPARGGSKRLPRKNVLALQGKPLIAWSIDAGLNSRFVDRVVVSTDSHEIAEISRQYGADVPFMRPLNIAGDTATTNSVILHMINTLNSIEQFDIVVILQPTSPLRMSTDIDDALEMVETKQAEGVVSVCECEHSPYWSNTLPSDGNMGRFIREDLSDKRSQDLPICYRLNGAVYAFTVSSIIENKGLSYSSQVYSFIMPAHRSIDIDNALDFKLAEFLINI